MVTEGNGRYGMMFWTIVEFLFEFLILSVLIIASICLWWGAIGVLVMSLKKGGRR